MKLSTCMRPGSAAFIRDVSTGSAARTEGQVTWRCIIGTACVLAANRLRFSIIACNSCRFFISWFLCTGGDGRGTGRTRSRCGPDRSVPCWHHNRHCSERRRASIVLSPVGIDPRRGDGANRRHRSSTSADRLGRTGCPACGTGTIDTVQCQGDTPAAGGANRRPSCRNRRAGRADRHAAEPGQCRTGRLRSVANNCDQGIPQ